MRKSERVRNGPEPLLTLSASLATRRRDVIQEAMQRAAEVADPMAVEEVLLQAHLFIGFPDALNAFVLWREITDHSPGATREVAEPEEWRRRGERICSRIYAANYHKLRSNVAHLHPDLEDWMVTGGYGRVLGRPGLDLPSRELCLVALLAVWDVPRQLHSHLRGALNAGADPERVGRAVEIACELVDAEQAEQVRSLWDRVRESAREEKQ